MDVHHGGAASQNARRLRRMPCGYSRRTSELSPTPGVTDTGERRARKLARGVRWGEVGKVPSWQLAGPLPNFLLGFAGPKEEAEEIKTQLRAFLGDTLKLELSEEKTLVTHATTEAAH